MGKSGSGKGTQAHILRDKYGFAYIGSGDLLRARSRKRDFTGRKIAAILSAGELIPTPAMFKVWLDRVEELKTKKNLKGVVIDGSPRKILEAYLIDDALPFYEWDKNVKILLIDITDEEAIRRLVERGRHDDALRQVRRRLAWFKTEVHQILNYYRKTGRLIHINGMQTPAEVSRDILKVLGLHQIRKK